MFKFKDCNMRHKVLSQLLEGHWVTCLFFFTRTQSHNSERKSACAQQKGEITKCFQSLITISGI